MKLGVHSPCLSLCSLNRWVCSHTFLPTADGEVRREAEIKIFLPEGTVSLFRRSFQDLWITMRFLCILEGPREAGKLRTKSPARALPLHTLRAQAEGGEGLFVGFSLPSSTGTVILQHPGKHSRGGWLYPGAKQPKL